MSRPDGPYTGRPPTRSPRGAVATPHFLASATGLHLLRAGGSAVDALIGAHAVLCVVYPHWTGLGGDGFWMVAEPGSPEPAALNASGPAARLASRDFYLAAGHSDRIPARGPLSALTVPGAVDGWRAVHERFGRLPWAELFADAIHLAREGFAVPRSLAFWTALRQDELRRLPKLATSLEAIALHGARDTLYEGELAEGSPLRREDFTVYQSKWVRPVSSSYRGHRVFQLPPNSQGFAALQVLNLVEGFDVVSWGGRRTSSTTWPRRSRWPSRTGTRGSPILASWTFRSKSWSRRSTPTAGES